MSTNYFYVDCKLVITPPQKIKLPEYEPGLNTTFQCVYEIAKISGKVEGGYSFTEFNFSSTSAVMINVNNTGR